MSERHMLCASAMVSISDITKRIKGEESCNSIPEMYWSHLTENPCVSNKTES